MQGIWIAEISVLKSPSSIFAKLQSKVFLVSVRIPLAVGFLFCWDKAGINFCKLLLKAPDDKEIQEVAEGLAVAKEMSVHTALAAVFSEWMPLNKDQHRRPFSVGKMFLFTLNSRLVRARV